jgi:hypothetical protein
MKRRTRSEARSRATAPVDLDPAYLQAVKKLEAMPQNRSGADKTWVEQAMRSWRRHYARVAR